MKFSKTPINKMLKREPAAGLEPLSGQAGFTGLGPIERPEQTVIRYRQLHMWHWVSLIQAACTGRTPIHPRFGAPVSESKCFDTRLDRRGLGKRYDLT